MIVHKNGSRKKEQKTKAVVSRATDTKIPSSTKRGGWGGGAGKIDIPPKKFQQ